MAFAELLTVIAQLTGLLFVFCSMLGMGMSLTMAQIIQPLRNARLKPALLSMEKGDE